MLAQTGFVGVDETDPTSPSGFAYGLRISAMLTTDYRVRVKKLAVNVTPQDIIECFLAAGVRRWVLMGLHGYVGYLPMPRATQDVDVMVPYSEKNKAVKAIAARWPMLEKLELSQVVRFGDGDDRDDTGKPKPVIDVMLPWSPFQETILKDYVQIDEETGGRYPTLEASIVAKYAAIVSPHRSLDKKMFDAGDLRRIIKANFDKIDRGTIKLLADQVWEQGGGELLSMLELAKEDKPFPI